MWGNSLLPDVCFDLLLPSEVTVRDEGEEGVALHGAASAGPR